MTVILVDVTFERATPADVAALTAIEKRTFDDDSRKFRGVESGGPPGYDSEEWTLRMVHTAPVFKILCDGQVVGGMIVLDMGQGHFELGRIWIDPDYHNRGIGGKALAYIEQAFPQATRWTLDTPTWATRNRYFYAKHGYREVGEGDGFVYFEKRMK